MNFFLINANTITVSTSTQTSMDAESDGKRPSRAAAKCAEKKISKQVQEHINYESVQEETLNLKKERKKDPTVKVNVKKK